jgi:HK97 family phage prohead protease
MSERVRPDRTAEFRVRLKLLKCDKPLMAPLGRATATSLQRREYRLAQRGVREVRLCPDDSDWQVRGMDGPAGVDSDTNVLTFDGWASITGRSYRLTDSFGEYDETITPGAFARTLSKQAPVVLNIHHQGLALASTRGGSGPGTPGCLQLEEITEGALTGLHARAWLDRSRPDVQMVESAIRTGAADSMSFAFRVERQRWLGPNEDQRHIDEVNLTGGDVSIISSGQAASDWTAGLVSVRSKQPVTLKPGRNYRRVLADLRKS